jgi:hypothetical protein
MEATMAEAYSYILSSGRIDGPTLIVTYDAEGRTIFKVGPSTNKETELRVVEDPTAFDLGELLLRVTHRLAEDSQG